MKEKFASFFEAASQAGTMLREKTSEAGQAIADNTIQAIERWLEEFPKIEATGLQIGNFSFVMAISPSLEIELRGEHANFTPEKLDAILAQNKTTSLTGMIFSAVKTTYRLHSKVSKEPSDQLIVKIRLAISPEISVHIGRPRVV